MVRGGRWRLTLASAGVVLTGAAIGFVTNLVSSGITLKGWQWPAMWTAFGLLVLGAVGLDVHHTLKNSSGDGEGDGTEAEAEAEFAEVRRTYLVRLREWYRRVDLEILLPSDQSEHPPMLLGEVFVPQSVRDDPPPRELLDLPREVLLRLAGSGELPGLPDKVDRARLERAERDYRERPARPVLAAVAAASGGVVVLGDPGAGKSTLARYLMLALVAEELGAGDGVEAPLPGDLAGRLPLVVELRQFADPRWADADFLDFLDDRYQREGLGLPRAMLEGFLRSDGRALVVFDGLDEIFEPRRRNAVARQIDWFTKSRPQVRVVVTSRMIGYDRREFDRAGFSTLMLQDLTRRQIIQFTTGWFERVCPGRPTEAGRLRRRILDAIKSSGAVAELAGNPLLLTILAIIARRRELPRDRRSVYEHAVKLLVDQWDVNKELADRHTDLPMLDERDKIRMLHAVARRMQDGPAGLAGNHLPEDDLTGLFQEYFAGRLGLPADRAVQAARMMLQQLRDRNFILAGYGAGLYGFVHRAFLEYLAADDINERFTNRKLSEDELLAVYRTRWEDPAWTEVLVLLAGLIPEQFTVIAVTVLLNADPAWRARTAPPHHLLLALRLAEEIGDSPELGPHARVLTLAVIGSFQATQIWEPLTSGPWTAALRRAVSPLLTHSPGRRWLDHDLYRRWYSRFVAGVSADAVGESPAVALAMGCYLAGRPRSLSQLQHAAIHDESYLVRRAAVSAVGDNWAGAPEILAWLRDRAAYDPDNYVRTAAVWEVASNWAGDHDVLDFLRNRAAHDEHGKVRQAAVLAIRSGWADSPVTLPWLLDRAAHGEDGDLRATAVYAAGTGWAGAPGVLDLLYDRATHDESDVVRAAAVNAVERGWSGTPEAMAWLRDRATRDESGDVRAVAVRAVGTGWAGTSEVLDLLYDRATRDEHGDVRATAVYAAGTGWASAPGVLDLLYDRATHDESVVVRATALNAVATGWADTLSARLV